MAGLRLRPRVWAAILLACALSACSDPGPADSATPAPKAAPSAVETPSAPTPVTPAAAPESATVGGDGSAIQLSALSDADLEA
ncbi:MAG: hypothetical protein H7236_17685, partial [Gemmatimonadaceae bacterium]|nr:hypothetical protein [Caulobacter sp.]